MNIKKGDLFLKPSFPSVEHLFCFVTGIMKVIFRTFYFFAIIEIESVLCWTVIGYKKKVLYSIFIFRLLLFSFELWFLMLVAGFEVSTADTHHLYSAGKLAVGTGFFFRYSPSCRINGVVFLARDQISLSLCV